MQKNNINLKVQKLNNITSDIYFQKQNYVDLSHRVKHQKAPMLVRLCKRRTLATFF